MAAELWPKLHNLTTLSVTFHAHGSKSSMVRTIVPLCEKLVTFNLCMAPNNFVREVDMPFYLGPLLTSSTFENVYLDLPARNNTQPYHWKEVVTFLEYDPPQWKNLSVLTDVSHSVIGTRRILSRYWAPCKRSTWAEFS